MISLNHTTKKPFSDRTKENEQKQQIEPVAPKKIPVYCSDSPEVDFIRKKISDNKKWLETCKTQAAYNKVQEDTLFLENNILPILLTKTNIFYQESVKQFATSLDKCVQEGHNALLFYSPIREDYTEYPTLGIHNTRSEPDKLGNKVSVFAVNDGDNSDMFDFVKL